MAYLDVKDRNRNNKIYREIIRLIDEIGEEKLLVIMGDFNGHVGFLGPQELNLNGKLLLDFVEKQNLIMLNADDKCEGEITRLQRGEMSVLDYIMVSREMYNCFRGMRIDEDKGSFDLSDHCLLEITIEIEEGIGIQQENKEECVEYYRLNNLELRDEFIKEMEVDIGKRREENGQLDIINFEESIYENAENILKKTIKRSIEKKKGIVEPIWITEDIRQDIKKKREYNKA